MLLSLLVQTGADSPSIMRVSVTFNTAFTASKEACSKVTQEKACGVFTWNWIRALRHLLA